MVAVLCSVKCVFNFREFSRWFVGSLPELIVLDRVLVAAL